MKGRWGKAGEVEPAWVVWPREVGRGSESVGHGASGCAGAGWMSVGGESRVGLRWGAFRMTRLVGAAWSAEGRSDTSGGRGLEGMQYGKVGVVGLGGLRRGWDRLVGQGRNWSVARRGGMSVGGWDVRGWGVDCRAGLKRGGQNSEPDWRVGFGLVVGQGRAWVSRVGLGQFCIVAACRGW